MKQMVKPELDRGGKDVPCEFWFGMDINVTNPSAHTAS